VECPAVSSQQDQANGRQVFRSGGAILLWWVWVALAVAALIDLALQSHGHDAVVMALVVAAITGVLYACALRPRIIADATGITIENPLREYRVRWGGVESVDAPNALRVHCLPAPGAARGKILNSWAVQSSPRADRSSEMRAKRRGLRQQVPAGYGRYPAEAQAALKQSLAESTARQLDERAKRERAGGAAGGQPEARWAWLPIAAMVVPLVALIVVVFA
jgi:Bacterial PH domain